MTRTFYTDGSLIVLSTRKICAAVELTPAQQSSRGCGFDSRFSTSLSIPHKCVLNQVPQGGTIDFPSQKGCLAVQLEAKQV